MYFLAKGNSIWYCGALAEVGTRTFLRFYVTAHRQSVHWMHQLVTRRLIKVIGVGFAAALELQVLAARAPGCVAALAFAAPLHLMSCKRLFCCIKLQAVTCHSGGFFAVSASMAWQAAPDVSYTSITPVA
jgi:hypothetical protein